MIIKMTTYDRARRIDSLLHHAIAGKDIYKCKRLIPKIQELNLEGIPYMKQVLFHKKQQAEDIIQAHNE